LSEKLIQSDIIDNNVSDEMSTFINDDFNSRIEESNNNGEKIEFDDGDNNAAEDRPIIFKIIKRFYDTLNIAVNEINESKIKRIVEDDRDNIIDYLEGIRTSLKVCNKQNPIIFPLDHIKSKNNKISVALKKLSQITDFTP